MPFIPDDDKQGGLSTFVPDDVRSGGEFVPDDTPSISGRLRELLEQGMPGEHDGRFLSKTAKKPYRWTTTQAVLAAHLSGLCS